LVPLYDRTFDPKPSRNLMNIITHLFSPLFVAYSSCGNFLNVLQIG
jgi:hypothetical protein